MILGAGKKYGVLGDPLAAVSQLTEMPPPSPAAAAAWFRFEAQLVISAETSTMATAPPREPTEILENLVEANSGTSEEYPADVKVVVDGWAKKTAPPSPEAPLVPALLPSKLAPKTRTFALVTYKAPPRAAAVLEANTVPELIPGG
jgi:hypothetical protein